MEHKIFSSGHFKDLVTKYLDRPSVSPRLALNLNSLSKSLFLFTVLIINLILIGGWLASFLWSLCKFHIHTVSALADLAWNSANVLSWYSHSILWLWASILIMGILGGNRMQEGAHLLDGCFYYMWETVIQIAKWSY